MATWWLAQDDGEEFDDGEFLNLLTPEMLTVLGVILLVLLVVAVTGGWFIVRRLRRNPTVRGWANTARTQSLPAGPMRDLSELRGQVDELRARARSAIERADERGAWRNAPADLPSLATRLEESAAELADRLAGYARAPEQRVREVLPQARQQVELMEESERTLYRGLELASLPSDSTDLRQLQQDMDDEVQALQAYRDAYREFGDGRI